MDPFYLPAHIAIRVPEDTQAAALLYSSTPYHDKAADRFTMFSTSGADLPPGMIRMAATPSVAHSTSDSDLFKSPMPSEARELSMSPPPGGGGRGDLNKDAGDDSEDDRVDPKKLRCGVALHRTKDGYAGRANTIGGYFELNRQVRLVNALRELE